MTAGPAAAPPILPFTRRAEECLRVGPDGAVPVMAAAAAAAAAASVISIELSEEVSDSDGVFVLTEEALARCM